MVKKPIYYFDPKKNALLIKQRQISFEEIITILETNGAVDIVDHPHPERYPAQKMYVVEVNHYMYLVPFDKSRK